MIVPNPSNGIFTLTNIPTDSPISVYDMFGKVVFETVYNSSKKINLTSLGQGNYLIEIQLPNNNKRLKLVQF
jgi:hypothetical protein